MLAQHGIPVRHELPGVGENMQDHWQIRATYKVKNTITMNEWVQNPLRRYSMGAYYLLTKRGPMGTQPPQLCAFTRSDPSQETPNLQYHVSAASSERFGGPLHSWPGFSNGIAVVRPQSIGYCRIKSADPHAHPAILHNFLQSPEAQRVAVDAIRLTRRIVSGPALKRFEPEEHLPGPGVQSDDEILAYARQTVITVFHQSGTCKMGPDLDGGGGRALARAGDERAAGDRRVDHAQRRVRQHQCADHDDRRKGCRDDQGGSARRRGAGRSVSGLPVKIEDLFDVTGRVTIVTGGASGIGLAYAQVMAANGADVTLLDRNADGLAAAVKQLSTDGAAVAGEIADVTDMASLRRAVDAVAQRHGRIDVVFANAGISAGPGFLNAERKREPQRAVENIPDDLWDRVIDHQPHVGVPHHPGGRAAHEGARRTNHRHVVDLRHQGRAVRRHALRGGEGRRGSAGSPGRARTRALQHPGECDRARPVRHQYRRRPAAGSGQPGILSRNSRRSTAWQSPRTCRALRCSSHPTRQSMSPVPTS